MGVMSLSWSCWVMYPFLCGVPNLSESGLILVISITSMVLLSSGLAQSSWSLFCSWYYTVILLLFISLSSSYMFICVFLQHCCGLVGAVFALIWCGALVL
jgi:hypothetical protein